MIAYNMANSTEVAQEINIVGVYAQGAPLRGLPAKRRDFAVDYVEGDGDWVPDSAVNPLAQIFGGTWSPDERDTVITVNNPEHHGENYHEALKREGHSGKVPGGMRAAMEGKEYALGEQKGNLSLKPAGRSASRSTSGYNYQTYRGLRRGSPCIRNCAWPLGYS